MDGTRNVYGSNDGRNAPGIGQVPAGPANRAFRAPGHAAMAVGRGDQGVYARRSDVAVHAAVHVVMAVCHALAAERVYLYFIHGGPMNVIECLLHPCISIS